MNTKSQQIEFDVFPKDNKTNYSYLSAVKSDSNQESTSINVVFSHQSVIIIFICVLMSLVASFTLGVEKGKLIAKNNLGTEKLLLGTSSAALPDTLRPTRNDEKILPGQKTVPMAEETKDVPSTPQIPPAVGTQQKEEITTKSGYTIQVASVKTETSAKSLSESLIKKGIAAFTKQSGKYIVVLAGNFAKREDAQVKLRELKKTYADCFIKKI
mgnify:CR=1 FL=1